MPFYIFGARRRGIAHHLAFYTSAMPYHEITLMPMNAEKILNPRATAPRIVNLDHISGVNQLHESRDQRTLQAVDQEARSAPLNQVD